MDVKEYFSKLNQAAQNVFNDTINPTFRTQQY